MKSILTAAALCLALAAPAHAQSSDALFSENGVFGAAWGTDAEKVEAILLRHSAITKADLRDTSDTETADYLYSYNWANGGFTYELDTFVERDTDRFMSVELSHVEIPACDALENYFVARLGAGTPTTKELTDKVDGSPYTARTRIWVSDEVRGNIYGYVFLPASSDSDTYCMATIINKAAY